MSMKLTIDRVRDISVVRVAESRLMYPLLSDFSTAVVGLIGGGTKKVIVDLAPVVYIDSATIGCLMDLYRQAAAAGTSGDLRKKLKGPFRRSKIRQAEAGINRHDSHQGHIVKIMAFCEDLRTDQHVYLTTVKCKKRLC